MAEKQLAYRASGNDDLFADDDPLAELARIVGFDTRPASPVAEPVAPRQDPTFDLEDELLREFERYDAPRLRPADDVAVSPAREVSHHEAYTVPASSEPVVDQEPVYRSDAVAHEEPVFTDFDPATYGAVVEPSQDVAPLAAELDWNADEAFSPEPAVQADAWPEPVADVPALDVRDLADELEMSIAPIAQPSQSAKVPQWAAANIKLPLANFNTARRIEPVVAPVDVTPLAPSDIAAHSAGDTQHEFDESPALGFPAEQDRHEFSVADVPFAADDGFAVADEPVEPLFDLAAAARGDVQADAALTEPAYEEGLIADSFDADELLADVSRYPVPQRQPEPEVEIAAFDPIQPVAALPPEPVTPPQPAALSLSRQETAAVPDADDPFAGHDFELDLEGIELELAELDFTESKAVSAAAPISATVAAPSVPAAAASAMAFAQSVRPELAARAAPPVVAPVVAPVMAPVTQAIRPELAVRAAPAAVAPAFAAVAPVLATVAPVIAAAQVARPELAVRPAPAAVAPLPPAPELEQALPFDPSEIGDTGERVESFEGMHVPALPHVDHEEPTALQPEYDFDIDAEMASLFEAQPNTAPATQAAPAPAQGTSTRYVAPSDTALSQPGGELDEFERALEEDFRRSVNETSTPSPTAARMTFESSSVTADRRRAGSMRAIAAGVVAVAVLGSGVYAATSWLSHGGSSLGLATGQPRVITADKDPVKVVPEDPGGKVVPNQDKAVYDRVAGDPTPAPKQKALVSSSEQPVDVVQRTLVPETESPDDSDGSDVQDTASTPVGETEDPRLLPNQAVAANAGDSSAPSDQSSMTPRRVRTMIVKSDGTLVARDDTAATPADASVKTATAPAKPGAPAAAGNQMASADLKPAVADNGTPASALSEDAPSADSTPIRVVKTTKVGDIKPAGEAALPTTAPQAAATAAAAPVTAAPVPATRPVKPAAAAPAAAATHAQPTQVASASPATQPAKAAPAASAGVGGYVMQIASLPSEEEAKKSQANLSSKFGSVIGGHPIEVKKFDIAGKGTYYRVRVVAGSKDDAAALCVRYRQAGGSCLISK